MVSPRLLLLVAALCCATACNRGVAKAGAAPDGEMNRGVVEPYLAIQTALASDSVEGVKANAGAIATAASGLGTSAVPIDTAAVQLAAAADLQEARARFGRLSEAIDAYMAAGHLGPPDGVRVAFCPMVLKPWMQRDGALRNPYYGSQMLTCGSFRP